MNAQRDSFGGYVSEVEKKEIEYMQLHRVQQNEIFGSWTWDINSKRQQWSNEMYHIFGLIPSQVELNENTIWQIVHPEDKELVREAIIEALTKGRRYSLEYRIIRPNGTVRMVHAIGDVYFGSDHQPSQMIGTLHDITERKKMLNELLESESKFRGLLETAYDPIIIIDEDGKIDFANQQTKVWLGYQPEELIGKSIEVLIPDRFGTLHREQRAQYMKQPQSRPMGQNLALFAKRKDGSEFPVEVSLSPFVTSHGTIVTAFIKDMSDQKRAENQQKFLIDTSRVLSETMNYQERIQKISDLVVPNLADWCAVYVYNDEHLKLKASSQVSSIDSKLVQQLVQNSSLLRETNKLSFSSVAQSGNPELIENLNDEILHQITWGDESCMQQFRELAVQSLILEPMRVRGRVIGIICFACCKPRGYSKKDLAYANLIAERAALAIDNARLYQEAQSAIHLREDVLAIVSHDLKNPLGAIRGFNEIIYDSVKDNKNLGSDIVEFTEAIARSVRQMERLIGDLLDFAKIESGTLSIEARPCAVGPLIWEAVELVKNHADKKEIRIQVEFQSNLPLIVCDSDRIRQVLANILSNAIKFLPEKGFVKIRASLKDSEVEFAVIDNGPGISKENISHVFDRYWQAKETAKLGTGLGLSIAKGIIEGHQGRIWVESEVGIGTAFYFRLPQENLLHKEQTIAQNMESIGQYFQ